MPSKAPAEKVLKDGAEGAALAEAPPPTAPLVGLSVVQKLALLRELFAGRRHAVVLTHDNPDPDSMASAWALVAVLERLLGLKGELAYGGIIGRAENSAFVRVLKLPIRPVAEVTLEDYDLFALVDTQQSVRNHALPLSITADIVIDHHPVREGPLKNPFADIGGSYGATSTMLTEYVQHTGVELTPEQATALYYGIKADTRDLDRQTRDRDVASYMWLFPQIQRQLLAQIEHPELPPRYFRLLHQAITRARLFPGAVITDLGEVYTPDIVPEIAERLSFLEGANWSLAYGSFRNQLFLSLRVKDRRMNAGRLIRETCADLGGSAGGHGSMAGARLPLTGTKAQRTAFRTAVVKKFKSAFGVDGLKGVSLLSDEL